MVERTMFRLLLLVVVITGVSARSSASLLPPDDNEECTKCKEETCQGTGQECQDMREDRCSDKCSSSECRACRYRKECNVNEPCDECEKECQEAKRKRATSRMDMCKRCVLDKLLKCRKQKAKRKHCKVIAVLQCYRVCPRIKWREGIRNFGNRKCRKMHKICKGDFGGKCQRLRQQCAKRKRTKSCLLRCSKSKFRSSCLARCNIRRRPGRIGGRSTLED